MLDIVDEYVFMHDIEKYKGHWQEMFPGKRLCLEIGCGKGRFTIGMAELHPEKASRAAIINRSVNFFILSVLFEVFYL